MFVLNTRIDDWLVLPSPIMDRHCRVVGGEQDLERAEESTGVSEKRNPMKIQLARSLFAVAVVLWAVSAMQSQSLSSWTFGWQVKERSCFLASAPALVTGRVIIHSFPVGVGGM